MRFAGLLLSVCVLVAALGGCKSGPPPQRRPVPVGVWSFDGVGDNAADHVFQVTVLPLRNGRQGARIAGVVGGAGMTLIHAAGPMADREIDWIDILPGDASVGRFAWEVEGLDVNGRTVRTRVRVLIPRLPGHLDPDDPLSPFRVADHDLEASADLRFQAGAGAVATGRPPLDEPIFMTDPYKQ